MQENVVITLPGGAASKYIQTLEMVLNTGTGVHELIATHKDGTTTVIDMSILAMNLSVIGGALLGNGDYQLTVADPLGGPDILLTIPLSNYYVQSVTDTLFDNKNRSDWYSYRRKYSCINYGTGWFTNYYYS